MPPLVAPEGLNPYAGLSHRGRHRPGVAQGLQVGQLRHTWWPLGHGLTQGLLPVGDALGRTVPTQPAQKGAATAAVQSGIMRPGTRRHDWRTNDATGATGHFGHDWY